MPIHRGIFSASARALLPLATHGAFDFRDVAYDSLLLAPVAQKRSSVSWQPALPVEKAPDAMRAFKQPQCVSSQTEIATMPSVVCLYRKNHEPWIPPVPQLRRTLTQPDEERDGLLIRLPITPKVRNQAA